jgi:hypothetical protein
MDPPRNALAAYLPLLIRAPKLPPWIPGLSSTLGRLHATRGPCHPQVRSGEISSYYLTSSLKRSFTTGQGSNQCLRAMGDAHCLPYYTVLASYQLVEEAPRPLVADKGSAVLLCLTLESVDTDRQRIGTRMLASTTYRGLT